MKIEIRPRDAVIVVDYQSDLCPGGALPVEEGDKIAPVLNAYIRAFTKKGARVYATRDWHPPNHISFTAPSWPRISRGMVSRGCSLEDLQLTTA